MKEKILAALKTKYSNIGLSETVFDGVAGLLEITITEESQIDAVVGKAEGALKAQQAEYDRRVGDFKRKNQELETEKLQLTEKLKNVKPQEPNPNPNGGGSGNDEPEWAKKLREQQEAIALKQAQADKAEHDKILKASAKEAMIAKGIKPSLCDYVLSKSEISDTDTLDTLVAKGLQESNSLISAITPEAGSPEQPGTLDIENMHKDYFAQKKAEMANELKLKEDA